MHFKGKTILRQYTIQKSSLAQVRKLAVNFRGEQLMLFFLDSLKVMWSYSEIIVLTNFII